MGQQKREPPAADGSEHRDGVDIDGDIGAQVELLLLEEIMHGRKVRRLDEHDEAVDTAEAGDDSGRRADDLMALASGEGEFEGLDERLRLRLCLHLRRILVEQLDEAAVGRVEELLPQGDLLVEEALVVLTDAAGHSIVRRVVGLDDDLSARLVAAGAARRLRDQHEAALRRAEVRHVEARVRADDADGRDVGDVVPLRDHLRAEQDVVLAAPKTLEDLLMREFRRRRVAVHADDARRRHERGELLLELLRARAEVLDVAAAALRADVRHGLLHIAVVALELAVAMVDERQAAVAAADDLAAGAAHDERREAAPVEHDDDLLVPRNCLLDELLQCARDDVAVAHAQLLPHVDAMDDGQRDVADAPRHDEQRELPLRRAEVRLKRRRRTSEEQHGPVDARDLLGHDARVVAWRLVLLVAHVLLLVEDDEPDVVSRREERRARADDDARLIAAHAQDGVVALREAQAAVHDDEVIREVRLEGHDDLPRQRDLRHEHDDAAARRPHALRELDVDLRLAAARDALQEKALIPRRINSRIDLTNDLLLVLRQGHFLF